MEQVNNVQELLVSAFQAQYDAIAKYAFSIRRGDTMFFHTPWQSMDRRDSGECIIRVADWTATINAEKNHVTLNGIDEEEFILTVPLFVVDPMYSGNNTPFHKVEGIYEVASMGHVHNIRGVSVETQDDDVSLQIKTKEGQFDEAEYEGHKFYLITPNRGFTPMRVINTLFEQVCDIAWDIIVKKVERVARGRKNDFFSSFQGMNLTQVSNEDFIYQVDTKNKSTRYVNVKRSYSFEKIRGRYYFKGWTPSLVLGNIITSVITSYGEDNDE